MKSATGSSEFTASQPAPEAEGCVQLRASDLKLAFGGQIVLDGVNLELRQGEVVLLRGENGSGKTTLLNILTGNHEPDSGTIDYLADGTPRTFSFPRRWWQDLNPWDHFRPEFVAKEGIGRTWQDVRLFGSQSLRDNIAVAEPGHPGENPLIALIAPGIAKRRESDLNRQADAMLARLGLTGREESSADMVSLGQSKRVAIARAVAAGAKILFLDEPLAGLDRQGIKDVLKMLESLVAEHRLTLVIVEHVFNFVHLHHLVNVHWQLANGRIMRGDVNPITQSESIHGIPVISRPEWFSLLSGDAEVLDEPLPRGALLIRIRRRGHRDTKANPVMEIRGLVVKRGARTILGLDNYGIQNGFDLALYEGEIIILQAPNGWGKSTLFDAINGNVLLSHGEVILNTVNLNRITSWQRARMGIASLPSDQHSFPTLRVRDVLQLAKDKMSARKNADLAHRVCSSLSGGERKRVVWDALVAQRNKKSVFILDEPFNALDEHRLKGVFGIIESIESCNGAILILTPTTHHGP